MFAHPFSPANRNHFSNSPNLIVIMKKIILASLLLGVSLSIQAMSESRLRNAARFLSDRMAYELDLSPMQYDDCFEINYDFFLAANTVMDDVVDGYIDAINRYYDYLDYRNEDLRQVLDAYQYGRFLEADYFFSPIYTRGRNWYFRIYNIYNNTSFFYYDRPAGFYSYRGGHSRRIYAGGFYINRYPVSARYRGSFRIREGRGFDMRRRQDFGANVRDRGSAPRYNHYPNAGQRNRAADPRYRSERRNVNAPQINNRNNPAPKDNAPAPNRNSPAPNRNAPAPKANNSSPQPYSPAPNGGRSGGGNTRSQGGEPNQQPASTSPAPRTNSGGGGVARTGRR